MPRYILAYRASKKVEIVADPRSPRELALSMVATGKVPSDWRVVFYSPLVAILTNEKDDTMLVSQTKQ